MASTLSPQQAIIYAMITTSASDSRMSDAELGRIGWVVKELPVFQDFDENDLITESKECAKVVSADDGLNTVLDMIASALPEDLRETAFALAADVAASDQRSNPAERRFLQLLAGRLQLDPLVVAALARSAAVRHRSI